MIGRRLLKYGAGFILFALILGVLEPAAVFAGYVGQEAIDSTNTHPSTPNGAATSQAPSKIVATGTLDDSEIVAVLIHFNPSVTELERQDYIASIGGEMLAWIEPLQVAKVRILRSVKDKLSSLPITGASSPVDAVESDGLVYGTYDPNDPDLADPQRMYTPELLNLYKAWDYTTGSPDTVIAVLDTGITSKHPEFSGRILDGYDFYNDDDDPEDDHGHGTHVAGTAAAAINNGVGGAGLCGRCSILPIKVLNQNNAGTWSGVASGIVHAADKGADIIVMSLGSTSGTIVVENAINYALDKDVIIIAAAGNANSNRDFYPAAYPGVIGVGATDRNDERWALSNYGDYVDVSAPGHVIYSTYYDLNNSYDGHVFMSGTSMATPHVGGLAGLIKSQDQTRTSAEVIDILLSSAFDLGDVGRDDLFGHGRIDPVAALSKSVTKTESPNSAAVAGVLWIDSDVDGKLDADEQGRVSGTTIKLLSADDNKLVSTTKSDERGNWQLTTLPAGNYVLAVETTEDNLIMTNSHSADVQLKPNQRIDNKNFGFVNELPPTVIGGVESQRNGNEIVLTWVVTSDLVESLVVERAIGDEEFSVVEELEYTDRIVAARSGVRFEDTLPAGMEDKSVNYRMQVKPGNSYMETLTVEPSTTTATRPPGTVQPPPAAPLIFLPWVAH